MTDHETDKIEMTSEMISPPPDQLDIQRLLLEFKRIFKEQNTTDAGACFFNGTENLYGNEYLRVLVRHNGDPYGRIFLFFIGKIIPKEGTDHLPEKYGKFYELEYKGKRYVRFYKLQGPHNAFHEELCDLEGAKVVNARKILKKGKEQGL